MERESIVQYIGYCSDEERRTDKKLYSAYDVEYPLGLCRTQSGKNSVSEYAGVVPLQIWRSGIR